MIKNWDGEIPERRYAMFNTVSHGDYMVLITGDDIKTAENWGGFVCWVGGLRPAETRAIK